MCADRKRPLETTGRLLIRSSIEIERILGEVRDRGWLLAAYPHGGEVLFLSRLLHTDPESKTIIVACSDLRNNNEALLACHSVMFRCNHDGALLEFVASNPDAIAYEGGPAIHLNYPVAVVLLQRRELPRYVLPPGVPLRCEIDWGPISFDAEVVDISREGVGAIVYDLYIRIDPGTVFKRARIIHPQRRPAIVDVEVRYVKKVLLPDGKPANRAGCRFVGGRQDLDDLIRLFITELEAPAPGA
jgi:c-di-GMP-binding flagellar brake protein YcgR